jgi:hypothetical protein
MKKRLNTIKYIIKGQIFDWIFGLEGRKMKESIINTFIEKLLDINKGLKLRERGLMKVKPKAKEYLLECWQSGQAVNILTQNCVTKYLEKRKESQGGVLKPLKDEYRMFGDIQNILKLFQDFGFKVNWIFAFTRSDSERTRANKDTEQEFKEMYQNLAKDLDVLFVDWEDEFLNGRIFPSKKVLENFNNFVKVESFNFEFKRRKKNTLETLLSGESICNEEIKKDVKQKIACLAEEGRLITEELFPEGFIIIPTEEPERFDFSNILIPDFKDNLVCILKTSTWRLKDEK